MKIIEINNLNIEEIKREGNYITIHSGDNIIKISEVVVSRLAVLSKIT